MRHPIVTIAILVSAARSYADDVTYQRPAKPVASFVHAAPLTQADLGLDRTTLLLITPLAFPSIADVAVPEVRLTGARVNTRNRVICRGGPPRCTSARNMSSRKKRRNGFRERAFFLAAHRPIPAATDISRRLAERIVTRIAGDVSAERRIGILQR